MKNDLKQLTHAHVCGNDGDEQLTVMVRENFAPAAGSSPRVTFHASDAYGGRAVTVTFDLVDVAPIVELLAAELAKLQGNK